MMRRSAAEHPPHEPEQKHEHREQKYTANPASVVFDALLAEAKAAKDPATRRELTRRIQELDEQEFSGSNGIFETLPFAQQLLYALEFSRIPETQGTISQHIVGALTYELQGMQRPGEFLRSWLSSLPVERKLDALSYLATLGADAMAQGWADNCVDAVEDTVASVATNAQSNPLLRYAAKGTLQVFAAEHENPSRGIFIQKGDRTIGRRSAFLRQDFQQGNNHLDRLIRPPENQSINGKLIRIARDAVASFDHSLTPQAFAFFDQRKEHELESEGFFPDPRAIQAIRKALDSLQSQQDGSRVLDYANAHLNSAQEGPAHFWHAINPAIPEHTWEAYWIKKSQLQAQKEEEQAFAQQIQQEAENANMRLSEEFVMQAQAALATLRPGQLNVGDVARELQNSNPERQFSAAESLAVMASYVKDASPEVHDLNKALDALHGQHREQFTQARKKMEQHFPRNTESIANLPANVRDLEKEVLTSETLNRLRLHVITLDENSPAARLDFHDFTTIGTEARITTQTPIDINRLLGELHRPEVRSQLERDMGISLQELSVREQGQLLAFLARSTNTDVERTFAVIRTYGVTAAQAFLSGEFGQQFCQNVLEIGERLPQDEARHIFERYAHIVLKAQDSLDDLLTNVLNEGAGDKWSGAADEIRENLLQRGKHLLKEATAPSVDHENIERLLERATDDIVLFQAVWKTAKARGAQLQDMRSITITDVSPHEIPQATRDEMLAYAQENHQHNPDLAHHITEEIRQKLDWRNRDSTFILLKEHNEVVGFMRFDRQHVNGKEGWYCGSLNIRSDLQGWSVGEAFLEEAIRQKVSSGPIAFSFDLAARVGTTYIDRLQGIAEHLEIFTDSTDKTSVWVHAVWDQELQSYAASAPVRKTLTVDVTDPATVTTVNALFEQGLLLTTFSKDPNDPNLRKVTFIERPTVLQRDWPASNDTQTADGESPRYAYHSR